jgi:addiction module HigA family antidote
MKSKSATTIDKGKAMILKHENRMPEPTKPGEMLLEEWLTPLNLSQSALAERMGVNVQVVNGIVRGRRAVTAHTALRLASALGTTPEFWMNLQTACDLWEARKAEAARR